MKNIGQQVDDWKELKDLCSDIREQKGLTRKDTLQRFYDGLKKYYDTYHEKFNYNVPPKIR